MIPLRLYTRNLKNASDMGLEDWLEDLLLHYRVDDWSAIPERSKDGQAKF